MLKYIRNSIYYFKNKKKRSNRALWRGRARRDYFYLSLRKGLYIQGMSYFNKC